MKEALRQAKKAEKLGEVPIGCVIVKDGKIIARGYNRRNTDKNTLAHAELQAIIPRSEEHTSELQSHLNLVCRLLLEKNDN